MNLFQLVLGDLKFPFASAHEFAAFAHEMLDEPVDETLRMLRELKRDVDHVVMLPGGVTYTAMRIG